MLPHIGWLGVSSHRPISTRKAETMRLCRFDRTRVHHYAHFAPEQIEQHRNALTIGHAFEQTEAVVKRPADNAHLRAGREQCTLEVDKSARIFTSAQRR